jgi:hypothetical protein
MGWLNKSVVFLGYWLTQFGGMGNDVMVSWGGGFCVGLNLGLSVGKTDGFVGGVSGD